MTAPAPRVRIRFTKLGRVRFLGHRDLARLWERTLRRAGIPVAYSQGHAPRPRLAFGLALGVGDESYAEYLDVLLDVEATSVAGPELCERLSGLLPAGLDAVGAVVPAPGTESLQQAVVACSWRIEVPDADIDDLSARVDAAMSAPSLPVERVVKGRPTTRDLRGVLRGLQVGAEPVPTLWAEMATVPYAVRPAELCAALGIDHRAARVCRLHQWIERDGELIEPVTVRSLAVPSPARPVARRSAPSESPDVRSRTRLPAGALHTSAPRPPDPSSGGPQEPHGGGRRWGHPTGAARPGLRGASSRP